MGCNHSHTIHSVLKHEEHTRVSTRRRLKYCRRRRTDLLTQLPWGCGDEYTLQLRLWSELMTEHREGACQRRAGGWCRRGKTLECKCEATTSALRCAGRAAHEQIHERGAYEIRRPTVCGTSRAERTPGGQGLGWKPAALRAAGDCCEGDTNHIRGTR